MYVNIMMSREQLMKICQQTPKIIGHNVCVHVEFSSKELGFFNFFMNQILSIYSETSYPVIMY